MCASTLRPSLPDRRVVVCVTDIIYKMLHLKCDFVTHDFTNTSQIVNEGFNNTCGPVYNNNTFSKKELFQHAITLMANFRLAHIQLPVLQLTCTVCLANCASHLSHIHLKSNLLILLCRVHVLECPEGSGLRRWGIGRVILDSNTSVKSLLVCWQSHD